MLRKSYIFQVLTIFSECHKNNTKHTNHLEVDILIRNKFLAILKASGRILNKSMKKFHFYITWKRFKTLWVHGDIIGMLGPSGWACCGTQPEHESIEG